MTGTELAAHDNPDASTVVLFQTAWRTYRKMVDNDYLFHRGAYGALHRFLMSEVDRPFSFLDLACGDSAASAGALAGTPIAHYHGIDFSREALRIAETNLAPLPCSIELEERDFVEAVGALTETVDVAWIGLSLHHLRLPQKLGFMMRMRSLLRPAGHFLIYENASPDGETREIWMKRWDSQRPFWTAYTEDEWNAVSAHVHSADFPETDSTWRVLGQDAGFAKTRELFRSPTDLFRVYAFSA